MAPIRSGLTKGTPMGGAVPSAARVLAKPPPPQLAEKVACALLIALTEPIADASLPLRYPREAAEPLEKRGQGDTTFVPPDGEQGISNRPGDQDDAIEDDEEFEDDGNDPASDDTADPDE